MAKTEKNSFDGYEYHVRKRALWTPTGIAVLVAAYGVSSFFMLLPPIQSKDAVVLANVLDWFIHFESREILLGYSFSTSHVSASFSLVALVIVGIVILRASHRDNEAFLEAYPYMDLSFTPEEVKDARHRQRLTIAIGIAIIALAIVFDLALHGAQSPKVGNGVGFCVAAVGAWLITHGFLADRVAQGVLYNYEALNRTSLYRIEQYYRGPERDVVLQAKRRAMRTETANRVIVLVGVLSALALYFMPTLETPLWWVPLATAFGIASINVNVAVRWVLKRIEESDDLTALRNRIVHGDTKDKTITKEEQSKAQLQEHAAFEYDMDAIAKGVAAAEKAPAQAVVASEENSESSSPSL